MFAPGPSRQAAFFKPTVANGGIADIAGPAACPAQSLMTHLCHRRPNLLQETWAVGEKAALLSFFRPWINSRKAQRCDAVYNKLAIAVEDTPKT